MYSVTRDWNEYSLSYLTPARRFQMTLGGFLRQLSDKISMWKLRSGVYHFELERVVGCSSLVMWPPSPPRSDWSKLPSSHCLSLTITTSHSGIIHSQIPAYLSPLSNGCGWWMVDGGLLMTEVGIVWAVLPGLCSSKCLSLMTKWGCDSAQHCLRTDTERLLAFRLKPPSPPPPPPGLEQHQSADQIQQPLTHQLRGVKSSSRETFLQSIWLLLI